MLAAVAASSSSNDVEPGVLGFLVVAAMGVALVFLLRSMNKQFRKITPARTRWARTRRTVRPPRASTAGGQGGRPPSQHRGGSGGSSPPSQHETVSQEAPK